MINIFMIYANDYLRKFVIGYFHQYYTGFRRPGNPDFLNVLKNTFNSEKMYNLQVASDEVKNILLSDIPKIINNNNMSNCICLCVPRAKRSDTYFDSQLMFKKAVKNAAERINGVTDGTDCNIRIQDTQTTHLSRATISIPNIGPAPYPGITNDTCRIDRKRIENRSIILIDDIYTKNVNIDEDCIQALFDNGAKSVIFYAIGYTRRN